MLVRLLLAGNTGFDFKIGDQDVYNLKDTRDFEKACEELESYYRNHEDPDKKSWVGSREILQMAVLWDGISEDRTKVYDWNFRDVMELVDRRKGKDVIVLILEKKSELGEGSSAGDSSD